MKTNLREVKMGGDKVISLGNDHENQKPKNIDSRTY